MSNLVLLEDLGMILPNINVKKKVRFGIYKCYCGNTFKARTPDVKKGDTTSCGCYRKKVFKETTTKHGKYNNPLYRIWDNMISRCTNHKNISYENCGGRGIKVCDRWLDVKNFINDMEDTFRDGLSIDRINSDGNYEPSNCRWVSRNTQSRNTRKLMITNTSGYRGVFLNKNTNRWFAKITIDNKQKHLGYFTDKIGAAKAYDKYVLDNNLEHTINGVFI